MKITIEGDLSQLTPGFLLKNLDANNTKLELIFPSVKIQSQSVSKDIGNNKSITIEFDVV